MIASAPFVSLSALPPPFHRYLLPMPPEIISTPGNTTQTVNRVGLLWLPMSSVHDGIIALNDLGPLIPPPDASYDSSFNSVSRMLRGLIAANIQTMSTSNPHVSSCLWHALMIINEFRGQLLRLSNLDTVAFNLSRIRKKFFDLAESKWIDIAKWLDYLSKICFRSSTRTHLNLDQRHLIFTVILDFLQACFYSYDNSPGVEEHNIYSLILDDCLPFTARLWYGKAVRTSFRDLVSPTAATLFAGAQLEVLVRHKKLDWVVENICDSWVHISRKQLSTALLTELQQRSYDPYSRISHLSYNMVLTEFFDAMDSSLSHHLVSHNSLHIVTRVLYHVRSPIHHAYAGVQGQEARTLIVTITSSILKYLIRRMEGMVGISSIVLALRAGLLPAMLGSFAWIDIPGRVQEDTMKSLKEDFSDVLNIIRRHMIYLSVLQEVKREVNKMAKGFSLGRFGGVTRYKVWVEFEARLENLLAIAGPHILRRCDNDNCRRRDVRWKFPYCSGCREGCFCGSECQIEVWKKHQQRCKDIQLRLQEGKEIAPSQTDLEFAEKVIRCEIRRNSNDRFGVCGGADYTKVPPQMYMVKKACTDIIVTIPNGICSIKLPLSRL